MKWFIITSTILMLGAMAALLFSYWQVQQLLKLEAELTNNQMLEKE